MSVDAPILSVRGLKTWLHTGDAVVRAVDGVSFDVRRGETFALLGESGCGKSMTALSVMRLLPEAGEIAAGTVELDGRDLLALPETEMRNVRGRRIGMIFQEPTLSLNPVMTVGEQIEEALRRHLELDGAALDARVLELLDAVRIPDARRRRGEYPFQLSGGMKQRVMIATALACDPDLLIADEPTTALDVTIQAQILELLRELQARRGMSLFLITHDLAVVSEMAHRVAVMYAGELVETAAREPFFARPAHPYSRKLFDSLPTTARRGGALAVIRGSVPALTREFHACRFAERCDYAWDRCLQSAPALYEAGNGQVARCHLYAPGADKAEGGRREAEGEEQAEGGRRKAEGEEKAEGGRREAEGEEKAEDGRRRAEEGVDTLPPSSFLLPSSSAPPLLAVRDLKVHFPIHKGVFKRVVAHVKAVDGVSLAIPAGRTLGLVGESGCGKTTVGKGLLRLVDPTSGEVWFDGTELTGLTGRALRPWRKRVQIIFQDPYASLNPRMRIVETLEEGMSALAVGADAEERQRRIDALLAEVGLAPDVKYRYPHEFSGGQRQRIAIARALSIDPQLIVCDEPTSALDVSVQAQILNLLKELQSRKGLAYLFITHNMSVIEYLAHEVAVMYLGRIVEHGAVDAVLSDPRHPYTRALLSAVPVIDPETRREVIRLRGDLPSPVTPPAGCHFQPRCPAALPACAQRYPDMVHFPDGSRVACVLHETPRPG